MNDFCARLDHLGRDLSGRNAVMDLTTSEVVSLLIKCDSPSCGQASEKSLAWLIIHNTMSCPSCGAAIDLQSGDNGLRIQKLAQACAGIDISIGKSP
jgi:hypothetical protein